MAIIIRDFAKIKRWTTFLLKEYHLLSTAVWLIFIFNLFTPATLQAQIAVSIPREGFPYCEPFTGPGPFNNTVIDGNIRNNANQTSGLYVPSPTGQSLQLTPNTEWHNGYVIVDIPFSSLFGVKTSFEYYTYGGNSPAADGLSFFMFDADQPVNIGWLGGSLGYAPYVNADGTVDPGKNGIKGGYLGIGFDEYGNFAVGEVGQDISLWEPRIPHSVTIRAPESANYKFYNRFVTKPHVNGGITYTPPFAPSLYFPIDHNGLTRVNDCAQPGYRKVFIELIPNGIGYKIQIDMLVNHSTYATAPQRITFPPVDYPFPAPPRLKIGFAGANGGYSNFHEIANVTVNVSDVANLNEPQITDQNEVICVGDQDLEMQFNAQLATSDAFVTCLQLFDINTDPQSLEPNNTLPPTDFTICGLDGTLCVNKCDPTNYEIKAYDANGVFAGTFYSILPDLNTGNFNQLRDIVNVKFVPAPGFVGEASVYYNVTDNYGLTSKPGIITVTSHPIPVINPAVTINNPTCDGQEDGDLSGLSVSKLVVGFDYEWLFNGNSIGKAGATHTYNASTQTAVFALEGLNLGTYTLNVWNPSSTGGCYENFDIVISQENGTPVELDAEDKVICEGEKVSFVPSIDNLYNPSGVAPEFTWYLNANKSGGALVNGSTIMLEGNPVLVTIQTNGEITFSGLKYLGSAVSKSYTFYVEAKDLSTPTGNFCPFIGDVLASATVEVYPPLNFTVTHQDDWCLENLGSINAMVSGVTEAVTFVLEDQDNNIIATNTTGDFSGLSLGDYSIYASTSFCNSPIVDVTIDGPTQPLVISSISSQNSYCELANGSLEFSIQGGNVPFQSITLDGNPVDYQSSGLYVIDGLLSKNYTLQVVDREGCTEVITLDLAGDPRSEFSILGMDVCEGQPASVVIDTFQASSSTPVLNWYYSNSAGDFVMITDGLQVGGLTYSIDSNFELTIDGLKANPDPYLYFLNVTGDKVCDQGYISAEVKVSPGPEMTNPILTQIQCFGENTGAIQAQIPVGNLGDFEFSLSGDNGTNIPFISNNGLFQNLLSGVYELTIRRADGCISSISGIVITEPTLIVSNLLNTTDPTCGLSNGEASFEISGGTGDYSIMVNGQNVNTLNFTQTGNTFLIQDLEPGVYSLVISDENTCSISYPDFFTLVNDPGIVLDLQPLQDDNCAGGSVVLSPDYTTSEPVTPVFKWFEDQALSIPIQNTANPATGSPSFQIASNGTLTISGLELGSFTYFLEVSGPGICTFSREANVTLHPDIEADISIINETCFGASDGSISIVPKGGNGVFEFSLDGVIFSSNTEYSNLSPGKYTLQVRNDIGCEISYEFEIEGPIAPITINTPDLLRASCDLENGSIENLQISGGWGNYQIEWRKDSQTGPIISGSLSGAADLGPGTYFALISDSEGCLEVFSFLIEESSDPVYSLVNPLNSCFGTPVIIRPIHIAPNPSLPPAAFTEVKWYQETGQVGLIENGTDPQNSAIRYTIDDTDWLNPQLVVENLPVGTHDFYFYVECTGQEIKVEVIVYEVPEVIFDVTPITCFGDSNGKIKVESGSLPDYLYVVNGAAPIDQAELEALNLPPGTYTVNVSTPAGCPQIETLIIDSPAAALAISGLKHIDPGCGASNGRLNAVISGGWMPYSVTLIKDGVSLNTFSSADGKLSVTGLSTGEYQFEILDAQGCRIVSPLIDLIDGPTQILIDNLEICSGEDAIFTPELDPLAPGAIFNWTFDAAGANPIVSGSTVSEVTYQIGANGVLTVSGLTASNSAYTYYLTASGGGVCTGYVAQAEVKVFDSPTVIATVENEICFGDGGQITITASGESNTFTYSLNGQPEQNSNIFNVPVGTHTVLVNTPAGCFTQLSNIVVSGPAEPLKVSDMELVNPTCDLANGSISFAVTGGYGDYSVDVIKDGVKTVTVQADTNGLISINTIGSGLYQFEISDVEGCFFIIDEPLDLVEVPTEIIANDQNICEGDTAQILPSLPSNIQNPSYSWYFDANESQPIQPGSFGGVTYTLNSTGLLTIAGLTARPAPYTYYILASGQGICGVEPKPVDVYVYSIPTLRISNPSIVCDPEGTVDLTNFIEGYNPQVYDYNIKSPLGAALVGSELKAVNVSGNYEVSISSKGSNCYTEPKRILVRIADELLQSNFEYHADQGGGNIISNQSVQLLENVEFEDLSIGEVLLWEWDFGDGGTSNQQNPNYIFQAKGTYVVTLKTTDSIGCQSVYSTIVEVKDDYLVMMPNAFTPDGNINQNYKPKHRGISNLEFYVFNTWGELLYNSNSLEDQGWDGTVNGKKAPNGNYVYKVNYQTKSGKTFELAGVFILIR